MVVMTWDVLIASLEEGEKNPVRRDEIHDEYSSQHVVSDKDVPTIS